MTFIDWAILLWGALVVIIWAMLCWDDAAEGGEPQREDFSAYNRFMADKRRRQRNYAVCAWCGIKYDKETKEVYVTQPGWAPFRHDHKICDSCAEMERERLRQAKAAQR